MRPLLILLPLLFAPAAFAVPTLTQPFQASYEVTVDSFQVGRMERSLRPEREGWVLENLLYTTGLIAVFKDDRFEERSLLQMRGDEPVPLDYLYRYTSGSKEVIERVQFDWRAGTASQLRNGITRTGPVPAGAHDKLSYQLELPRDLAEGKRYMEYQVAERHELHDYRFNLLGEEELETPVGRFRCLKVERVRSNPKQAHTVFWAAIDLDYFLVQLRQDDDGHVYQSTLRELMRDGVRVLPAPAPKR